MMSIRTRFGKKILISIYKPVHRVFTTLGIRPRFLGRVNNALIRHLKSDVVVIDKHQLFLDADDSMRLSTRGYYEPFITKIVKKTVKEGEVVLDIGAHIGYYTLLFARLVGKKGKVYAFEPDPKNFALLKRNVEANGYNNVVLEQKAVSDKGGKVMLHLGERSAHHSILKNKYSGDRSVEVESVRLDDYIKSRVDFIKIDVEGAEYFAFKGMQSVLRKNKGLMMITEMVPLFLKNLHIRPESFVGLLRQHGLHLYLINEEKKQLLPFEPEKALKSYNPDRKVNLNLFCSKSDYQKGDL